MNKRTDSSSSNTTTSDPVFEFAAFLAAAARGSVEEGGMGASLRFLDALSRFPSVLSEPAEADEFLRQMAVFVHEHMSSAFLSSREDYITLLDNVQVQFAKEIRKRNGLPE